MNTAQVQGLRNIHAAYLAAPATVITKVHCGEGYLYEVRRDGILVGVTATLGGAQEIARVPA